MSQVRVVGGQDLARVTRALRQQADGRQRKKELTDALRAEGKKVVPEVRRAIKALPSKGESRRRGRYGKASRRKGLRQELSRSVTLQVRTSGSRAGVSVFMNPRKMPDRAKGLPGYFERIPGKERLRHPVFGDRETWVQNQNVPPQGYFTRAVAPVERRAVERCQQIVEQAAREIEDA